MLNRLKGGRAKERDARVTIGRAEEGKIAAKPLRAQPSSSLRAIRDNDPQAA